MNQVLFSIMSIMWMPLQAEEPELVEPLPLKLPIETIQSESIQHKSAGRRPSLAGGFWPTDRMLEMSIKKWTEELAELYDIEESDRVKVEESLFRHWPEFLEQHRSEMQPLLAEYIEARMSSNPPSSEEAKRWATRARPVLKSFMEELEDTRQDLRPYLPRKKRRAFDRSAERYDNQIEALDGRLAKWERGEFKELDWQVLQWMDNSPKTEQPKNAAQANAADDPRLQGRVDEELIAWRRFTGEFVLRFRLDESQKRSAESILAEMLERARAYQLLHATEIFELEKMIADGNPADKEIVELEAQRLYGPVDEMFRILHRRLNGLPTNSQRAAADARAADSASGGK
jgi:hypothetical protein